MWHTPPYRILNGLYTIPPFIYLIVKAPVPQEETHGGSASKEHSRQDNGKSQKISPVSFSLAIFIFEIAGSQTSLRRKEQASSQALQPVHSGISISSLISLALESKPVSPLCQTRHPFSAKRLVTPSNPSSRSLDAVCSPVLLSHL